MSPTATTDIYTLSLHDALPIFKATRADELGDALHGRPTVTTLEAGERRLGRAHPIGELGLREAGTPPSLSDEVVASDRKSTRLNSSHGYISYAVFCLKKKRWIT